VSSAGAKPDSPSVALVLGHSIAHGVGATDTVYGGVTLPAGISVRDGGVNLSAWPDSSGTGPDPGVLPYLAANMGTGTIIRRATNGQILSGVETTELPNAIADCTALGIDRRDVTLCVLMIGENDAQNGAESAAYAARIGQTCALIEAAFPNVRIVVQNMRTEDASYSEFAVIRAANVSAVAARATRALADYTGITLNDAVHYDLAGYATAGSLQWVGWQAAL